MNNKSIMTISILAGILTISPALSAGMPAECRGKLHLAEESNKLVQDDTVRVWETSQNLMVLGNDMRSWTPETFDAERAGTVMNQAGSAQQQLAWSIEIHLKNTSEVFDCISLN